MSEFEQETIEMINEVKDNLWLGDIIQLGVSLKKIQAMSKSEEKFMVEKQAELFKNLLHKYREEARKKEVSNRRFWVSKKLSEEIKKRELSPKDNINGVLVSYLHLLKDAVSYLVKQREQIYLDESAEEKQDDIVRTEKYRYIIHQFPSKWEIKAIINELKKVKWSNFVETIEDTGFSVEQIEGGVFSNIINLYSTEMYTQIVLQRNLMRIQFYAKQKSETKYKIQNLTEKILDSFSA